MVKTIDIAAFRIEILGIVEANREKITSFEIADDHSIFTFCGRNYTCEVTINEKWIGVDLCINTYDGAVSCGYEVNTDLYPLDYDVEVTLEIYDEVINVVKALFAEKVFYTSNEKFSYTAVENTNGTYVVNYSERKKFLFWSYTSGWLRRDYSRSDFGILKLKAVV